MLAIALSPVSNGMETKLYNQQGDEIGTVKLPEQLFGVVFNADLVHQVVVSQMANSRSVIAHTKGRGEVRGGGKKPWRQKGTGRARHASIRSPIWKGGGVAFGPTKERIFTQKINKKMKRSALAMILSAKFKDKEILFVDNMSLSKPKTKEASRVLKALSTRFIGDVKSKKGPSLILILPAKNQMIERAFSNIPRTEVISAQNMNARSLLEAKQLILTKESLPVIESRFKV